MIENRKVIFKNVCVLHLVCRNSIVELVSKVKAPDYAALNKQNLEAVIFSSGRLLHPPSPLLPICLRIARARPAKVLKAISFPKKINPDFNPHESMSSSVFS